MKLKNYIISGYLLSMIVVVISVFVASNLMLIDKKDIYFIIFITLISELFGVVLSLTMLSGVFKSLKNLENQINSVSNKQFEFKEEVRAPKEFRELSSSFNQMSKSLKQAFDTIEEGEKEKSLMIAQLSHDIKTPITSIQGTIEGMLDGIIIESEYKSYFKTIGKQVVRLNKLVEELNYLTLSDFSNEVDLVEEFSIDKLLIDSMSEFSLKAEKENRTVNIRIYPENAKIVSSYNKIQRIIVNLLSNAFKYSYEGTKIEIIAEIINTDLIISIIDEGIGIPKEELENIFKRLYRVEASRNMSTGGHGLGLSIAKQLAHQINGDILVESNYGEGSKFTLLLKNVSK